MQEGNKQEFQLIPDSVLLSEHRSIDNTGKYIETCKSKQYKYKVKLIKKGLKVINRDMYKEFVIVCFSLGDLGKDLFTIIHSNTARDCILTSSKGEVYTTKLIAKKINKSVNYANKGIKKLVDAELIKRHKKNFMLSPYVFYPYISDVNLKILQEYWEHDFKKSKEIIASEMQIAINLMLEDAKEFTGFTTKEFEKLKTVQELS